MAAITKERLVPPSGFRRRWNRSSATRTAWLYLAPAFIIMGIITFYPLFYQVWMSLTNYGIASLNPNSPRYVEPAFVGVQNYAQIFTGELPVAIANFNFWNVLAFNLLWTFTNVPFHVVIGVLIAVLLNVKGLWFKRFYRAIYILPIVLPSLVIAVVWRNMFDSQYGAINQALSAIARLFGGDPVTVRWMEQVDPIIRLGPLPLPLSYFALLICNIWLGWPFMTIVATGALQSIPGDLYEAASIDGASSRQSFFKITVPLLRPAMIPAAVYGIVATFNLFNLIYLMSSGGPLRQTEILVTTAYRLVNEQRLYGSAAAFSVIIFFVLLGLTLVTNRITKATERYDA
ncbi:Maltose/maltodextrin transport system permease protein MalF [Thermoflexales bacterium]|nr:Maltose/maltodextrin transport system permease protein MalF [Thermoflexales bacterium]